MRSVGQQGIVINNMIENQIDMQGVTKTYGDFCLQNVDLQLPRGEVLGVIGPNGAGKSTLLRLLMGFSQADSGKIRVLGHEVPKESVAVKKKAAYVSEDMRLFSSENLSWHMHFVASNFPQWDKTYAKHLLKILDLDVDKKVKYFSLGQRVKATLLLALARRPELLVLDEPSTGLDPVARYELTHQLFELVLNEDHSIIFSSQFTQDVESISDSIAFIDNGVLISNEDKETYLDRWRRIELVKKGNIAMPLLEGIVSIEEHASNLSVVCSGFNESMIARCREQGFDINNIHHLSLEEIFIQQVLHRRKKLELSI